jgi:hypothetical protein
MSSILVYGRDITDPVFPVTFADGVAIGNMVLGAYSYKYTFRTRYGETLASPPSGPVTTTKGSVDLSDIPIYPNNEVTARRIYRTSVGDVGPFRFLAEITDNITTTYTDIAADTALGAPEPIANFASTVGHFEGWHRFNRQLARSQGNIVAAGLVQATSTLIGDYEYVYVTVPVNLNGVRLPAINPNLVGLKVTINNMDMFNSLNVYPYELTTAINGGVPAAPYAVLPSFSLELICNGPTSWIFASALTAGVAGPPSGAAGGDLLGTYPAPALVTTGVTAATYGDSTHIPVVTFDAKGRATLATTVLASTTPGGVAGGDLAGFYPAPVLAGSGVVAGTYGSATFAPILGIDSKGRVISASSTLITAVATGAAGGDLTGAYPNPTLAASGVTAGTYGSTSQVPVINLDSKGRVTSAVNVALTAVPGGAASGDLTGTYPGPSLAASGVTAGTYGSASQVPVIAIDAKGRVTSALAVPVGSGPPSGAAGGSLGGSYPNPTLSTTGVIVGTYTKVTVNLEGRVTTGSTLAQTDIPAPLGDINGTFIATVVSSIQGVGAVGLTSNKVLMISNNSSNTALSTTAFGVNALFLNSTGPRNTAVGADSLAANTTSADNTALGVRSLLVNTIGNRNTALGKDSLKANVSANDSTAVGYLSLGLSTGSNNTAVGASSGAAITTGSGNVIFGVAGSTLSTGSNNIVIGQAADSAAAAVSAITIGHAAATGSGSGQISIGKDAGNIASSGAGNISIGTNSGVALTTGANNTIVGPNAGSALTTGTNNIIIGNTAAASAVGVSNEMTLGNAAINQVRFGSADAVPTYADQAAAGVGGLTAGMLFKTATGQLMIVL